MKNFAEWFKLKEKINAKSNLPTFREREIWWCYLGANVGDEEDGKNSNFHRPVLVVRKFTGRIFLSLPLTTKIKDNKYYHKFQLNSIEQSAMLFQIRVLDARRLTKQIGLIDKAQFEQIRIAIKEII